MTGTSVQTFVPVKIIAEVLPLGILSLYHLTAYLGMQAKGGAQGVTGVLVLADPFGNNILSTLQRVHGTILVGSEQ